MKLPATLNPNAQRYGNDFAQKNAPFKETLLKFQEVLAAVLNIKQMHLSTNLLEIHWTWNQNALGKHTHKTTSVSILFALYRVASLKFESNNDSKFRKEKHWWYFFFREINNIYQVLVCISCHRNYLPKRNTKFEISIINLCLFIKIIRHNFLLYNCFFTLGSNLCKKHVRKIHILKNTYFRECLHGISIKKK